MDLQPLPAAVRTLPVDSLAQSQRLLPGPGGADAAAESEVLGALGGGPTDSGALGLEADSPPDGRTRAHEGQGASGSADPPNHTAPGGTCEPFPVSACADLNAVAACESGYGRHPDTYRLDAANGGRLQISRHTWAEFLRDHYGWSWADVVLDDAINQAAAYVIWQRAGNTWEPWRACAP